MSLEKQKSLSDPINTNGPKVPTRRDIMNSNGQTTTFAKETYYQE